MKIRNLIYLAVLAGVFSGCNKKESTEDGVHPSFSGTNKPGSFVITKETLTDKGIRLTPGAGGEKIYAKIIKAQILEPTEYSGVKFSIRGVKNEDENWHSLFNSKIDTVYTFSDIERRLQSAHGDPIFEIGDFADLGRFGHFSRSRFK